MIDYLNIKPKAKVTVLLGIIKSKRTYLIMTISIAMQLSGMNSAVIGIHGARLLQATIMKFEYLVQYSDEQLQIIYPNKTRLEILNELREEFNQVFTQLKT